MNPCDFCQFAYLCYGVDTDQCESYKAILKKKEKEDRNTNS